MRTCGGIPSACLTSVSNAIFRNKGAFVIGITAVTFTSWIRNTAVTYFPDNPAGDARFEYFSQVVSLEPVNDLLLNFSADLRGVGIALVVRRFS